LAFIQSPHLLQCDIVRLVSVIRFIHIGQTDCSEGTYTLQSATNEKVYIYSDIHI
jgi:hypothetical protein